MPSLIPSNDYSLDKVITVFSFKQEEIEAYQEEMSANCEHLSIINEQELL